MQCSMHCIHGQLHQNLPKNKMTRSALISKSHLLYMYVHQPIFPISILDMYYIDKCIGTLYIVCNYKYLIYYYIPVILFPYQTDCNGHTM